ncbi:MAG: hypothetical protein AAGJ35_00395, partial [Myxococcota bacterium]
IFDGLSAGKGYDAILSVHTFLQRVEALANGLDPERAGTLEEDQEAVELLAKRKILDAETKTKLEGWLKATQDVSQQNENYKTPEQRRQERNQSLVELYIWYKEWSTAARTVLSRKDHRIALGLSSRSSQKKAKRDDNTPSSPEAN